MKSYFFSALLMSTTLSLLAAEPLFFCTAADELYFSSLLNLIGSIHKVDYDATEEIAVFDLGLTQSQKKFLATIEKVNIYDVEQVNSDILTPIKTNHSGKAPRGLYSWKPVVIKQALDMFPYVLYLDSGTTVLNSVRPIFTHIKKTGYFLIDCGWSIRWQATQLSIDLFSLHLPERRWILNDDTLAIDGGLIGVTREYYSALIGPVYELAEDIRNFVDDGTTPDGFGTYRHDQTLFSMQARLMGLEVGCQDHGNGNTMILHDGAETPCHITWNPRFVTEKTMIYRSRADIKLDVYQPSIKIKT